MSKSNPTMAQDGYQPATEGYQPKPRGYQPQASGSNAGTAPKPPSGGSSAMTPAVSPPQSSEKK